MEDFGLFLLLVAIPRPCLLDRHCFSSLATPRITLVSDGGGGEMEVTKKLWSIEDSVKYIKVVGRNGTIPATIENSRESIVLLESSGRLAEHAILSRETATKWCTADGNPLRDFVEKVDAHAWSDAYVLERQEEQDVLWEVYYLDRRECLHLRALERCHRRSRPADVLEKRGKIQRRTHFRGMTIDVAVDISSQAEFLQSVRSVLEESMDVRFRTVTNSSQEVPTESAERGKADVAWGLYGQDLQRMDSVQFTTPLETLRYNFYIKKPTSLAFDSGFYSKPFNARLWLAFLTLIGLAFICIAVVGSSTGEGGGARLWDGACSALLQEYGDVCDRRRTWVSRRMVLFWTSTLSMICYNCYSGTLISQLSVARYTLPFRTVEDLVQMGDQGWTWAFTMNGSTEGYFRESQSKVFLEFVKRGLEVKEVMKNGLDETMAVLFNEWKAQTWLDTLPPGESCSILKIPQDVRTATKGFAVPKGSPLKKFLNFQILRLRERGVLSRLNEIGFPDPALRCSRDESAVTQPIGIYHALPAFFILLGGIVLSAVVLILEFSVFPYPRLEATI